MLGLNNNPIWKSIPLRKNAEIATFVRIVTSDGCEVYIPSISVSDQDIQKDQSFYQDFINDEQNSIVESIIA